MAVYGVPDTEWYRLQAAVWAAKRLEDMGIRRLHFWHVAGACSAHGRLVGEIESDGEPVQAGLLCPDCLVNGVRRQVQLTEIRPIT